MTGNEDVKVGDKLMCMSSEGLSTFGSIATIKGLNETEMNTNGSRTGWFKRSEFRWNCYMHLPQDSDSTEQPNEVGAES